MNAIWLALIGLSILASGYIFYGRFLARRVFGVQPETPTPAHRFTDGVDFVPARGQVLFGHHFASIAGLAPMLGPAIAVIWGWLPAFIWVVFGAILLGGVHDFGALMISLRHDGRSIGDLVDDLIGRRARMLFLLITFFLLALVVGVFGFVVALLFTSFYPEAVLPSVGLMVVAMIMGVLLYKKNLPFGPLTAVALVIMAALLWGGIEWPWDMKALYTGETAAADARVTWTWLLLVYCFVASVLPVWLLLQPRDYINSFLLIIGLGALYLGLFIAQPTMVAPAINHQAQGLPPLVPFLFITVACGAISGFHNLVASGTTARQIDKEKDAKAVSYGAMLAESSLALVAILACTAGVASTEAWHKHYASWGASQGLGKKLDAFITGGGNFVSQLGVSAEVGSMFIAVVVTAFALTTLDSATRLLRFNVEELGKGLNLKFAKNRYIATAIAVAASGYFALMTIDGKPAGIALWALFGTSNQLLAALGLLVVSIWMIRERKPAVYVVLPMLGMLSMVGYAIAINLRRFYREEQWPLFGVGTVVMILAVWLVIEALIWYVRHSGWRGAPGDVPATP